MSGPVADARVASRAERADPAPHANRTTPLHVFWRRRAVTAGLLLLVLGLPSFLIAGCAVSDDEPVAGAGMRPTSLTIDAIDVKSDVDAVGQDDRILQIPAKPWVVGWWDGGVGVGSDHGTAVLVAHLDSRQYGTGPFSRAKDLRPGDGLSVTDATAGIHRYAVSNVTTYLKTQLPYDQLFAQSGAPRVVLVTCGGTYHKDAGGWDSNVVVTFVPA